MGSIIEFWEVFSNISLPSHNTGSTRGAEPTFPILILCILYNNVYNNLIFIIIQNCGEGGEMIPSHDDNKSNFSNS